MIVDRLNFDDTEASTVVGACQPNRLEVTLVDAQPRVSCSKALVEGKKVR